MGVRRFFQKTAKDPSEEAMLQEFEALLGPAKQQYANLTYDGDLPQMAQHGPQTVTELSDWLAGMVGWLALGSLTASMMCLGLLAQIDRIGNPPRLSQAPSHGKYLGRSLSRPSTVSGGFQLNFEEARERRPPTLSISKIKKPRSLNREAESR